MAVEVVFVDSDIVNKVVDIVLQGVPIDVVVDAMGGIISIAVAIVVLCLSSSALCYRHRRCSSSMVAVVIVVVAVRIVMVFSVRLIFSGDWQ